MGRIVNRSTDEVILESDDIAEINAKSEELSVDWNKDHEGGLPYYIEGFDSGELESGEVRNDPPIQPPPTADDRIVHDLETNTVTLYGDATEPANLPEDVEVVQG